MGQFRIRIQGPQCRNGLIVAVGHDDGITFDVTVALGLPSKIDVKILF